MGPTTPSEQLPTTTPSHLHREKGPGCSTTCRGQLPPPLQLPPLTLLPPTCYFNTWCVLLHAAGASCFFYARCSRVLQLLLPAIYHHDVSMPLYAYAWSSKLPADQQVGKRQANMQRHEQEKRRRSPRSKSGSYASNCRRPCSSIRYCSSSYLAQQQQQQSALQKQQQHLDHLLDSKLGGLEVAMAARQPDILQLDNDSNVSMKAHMLFRSCPRRHHYPRHHHRPQRHR